MPGGSGCGQSKLGEKSMKHRRILKCFCARSVSQHARCHLSSSEIIPHGALCPVGGGKKKKKKPDKNKPNQNTADCSMLSVSHLKGEEKEIS